MYDQSWRNRNLLQKLDDKVQWELCFKLYELLTGYKKKIFHHEDGEQVAQRGCAVSILGDLQD